MILAAGFGDRLRPFTNEQPKCLVPVTGVPILDNTLEHLSALKTKEVVIVVGHKSEVIIDRYGPTHLGMTMIYVESKDYSKTNNIYSLWLARKHLTEDVLLIEADVFFERAVLERLLSNGESSSAVVSRHESWMSGTVVTVDARGRIEALFDNNNQAPGFDYSKVFKTANLYVLRSEFMKRYFLPQLEAYIASGDYDEYYESVLITLAHRGRNSLDAVICDDLRWYEIDDESDRQAAEYLFSDPEQRYEYVGKQHGGYWRFDFVDHAYLYNPYYPPQSVFTHFESHLRDLVLNYPVGQNVVARRVGTLIEQDPTNIVVGNGASELINIISGRLPGPLICPVPSFNEYENATKEGGFVPFALPAPSFELDVDAFAEAVIASGAKTAVVVTPNNPTSLAVPREDILRLAAKLEGHDCVLIVDESFADFAANFDELTVEPYIESVKNLAVLKSLSKSFGIGGLRLGYLLTANEKLREAVKAELHIWNINGFAESFLKLAPRYRRVFKKSCAQVRVTCDKFYEDLSAIAGVFAYKPEANFVMIRVEDTSASGPAIAKRLFVEESIYVKHCAGKAMPNAERYLRIASRTEEENDRFVQALRAILGE